MTNKKISMKRVITQLGIERQRTNFFLFTYLETSHSAHCTVHTALHVLSRVIN